MAVETVALAPDIAAAVVVVEVIGTADDIVRWIHVHWSLCVGWRDRW